MLPAFPFKNSLWFKAQLEKFCFGLKLGTSCKNSQQPLCFVTCKGKSVGPSLNCNPKQQGREQQGEDRGCPSAQAMWKNWTPTLTHSEKKWCIININAGAWLFWRALVAQQSQSAHYGQLCFTVTCCSLLLLIRAYCFTSEFVRACLHERPQRFTFSIILFKNPPAD